MNRTDQRNTHWEHGPAKFKFPPLDDYFGMRDGLFPLRGTLAPEIGEEIVLVLRDQTAFMEELRLVSPFLLVLQSGVAQNEFGPLAFLVFRVPSPANPAESFAAYEVYLNPHSAEQMATWRQLAAQSHWHLFLIGEAGEQRGFFECENTFDLGRELDSISQACGSIALVDFDRAKAKFMEEHTLEDLLHYKGVPPASDGKLPPEAPARVVHVDAGKPPTPAPDAFYLAHLDEWLVVDVNTAFPRVPHIKAYGTHAAAFLYVDHEAGLRLRVEGFLVFSSDGFPRMTRHTLAEDAFMLTIGQETLQTLRTRPMSPKEHADLDLPKTPLGIELYHHAQCAQARRLRWLDPFRAPWFPDDISFQLHGPAGQVGFDLIWGRIEALRDKQALECTLLNEPLCNPGFRKGNRVMVKRHEVAGQVSLRCVGSA